MRLALARGTDSATNRESITVLQLCSTQRRLTGLRPAHPRLSRHSHTLRVGRVASHLKAPCVTWPARKTIGHALGVSETVPQTEKAGGPIALTQNVAGVHGDVGNLRQVDGGRPLAGQRQRRLVCPGQEPVSRSRHAPSESDGGCGTLTGSRDRAKAAQTRRHISELPGDVDRIDPAKSEGAAPGRRFLHRAGMHGVTLGARV